MKKVYLLLFTLFTAAAGIFAERLPPAEVESITKGNLIYHAAINISKDQNSFFGIAVIESVKEPKYSFALPIYAIESDTRLERDVQWKFIKSMEFKDENTITIVNERNHTFELNINTFEVKCVNTENNVFKWDVSAKERYECISGNINEIYEKCFENFVDRNTKYKYTKAQPERKKLTKPEEVIKVAEKSLFEIYGENRIKGEQPYRISKYKDKWIVTGSLPQGWIGGVFEIVINAENSQIESVIHGK